eukprot:GHVR01175085.1.p1 GENE.GHVR01175085.1~~GHVR01175085.1.p1  ORF type:complete len:193 (+),score=38.06 GHVR01175085.1:172-750(+)
MSGKNCVAVASDTRLGIAKFNTVSTDFKKSFVMNNNCFIGLSGLATDIQTFHKLLSYRMNMYSLNERRDMLPKVMSSLVASMLYERRFGPYFVSPVVAGLDNNNIPFLSTFDCIGAQSFSKEFVVNGTCEEQLFGVCETFWKPDMSEEELFETISQCLLSSTDRDCVSGWGATVHIMTPERIYSKSLKSRMD